MSRSVPLRLPLLRWIATKDALDPVLDPVGVPTRVVRHHVEGDAPEDQALVAGIDQVDHDRAALLRAHPRRR